MILLALKGKCAYEAVLGLQIRGKTRPTPEICKPAETSSESGKGCFSANEVHLGLAYSEHGYWYYDDVIKIHEVIQLVCSEGSPWGSGGSGILILKSYAHLPRRKVKAPHLSIVVWSHGNVGADVQRLGVSR